MFIYNHKNTTKMLTNHMKLMQIFSDFSENMKNKN